MCSLPGAGLSVMYWQASRYSILLMRRRHSRYFT